MEMDKTKAPAVGISFQSTFGNNQVVIQTHYDRDEDFELFLNKCFDISNKRQTLVDVLDDKRQAKVELPQIEDAKRKQLHMLEDYKRQKQIAAESLIFAIEHEIQVEKLKLEKILLEIEQLNQSANKRIEQKKDDIRYIPPEHAHVAKNSIDAKMIQAAISRLEQELNNPSESRAEMRNLSQIKCQIDRSEIEIGLLDIQIQKRQDLINGNDMRTDS